jgi:mannose-6-phosphate isomerase-like protein (cupin superfamily)
MAIDSPCAEFFRRIGRAVWTDLLCQVWGKLPFPDPLGMDTTPRCGFDAHLRRIPMRGFMTKRLPVKRDTIAPDGSDVRELLDLERGGMAHFELAPGQTSVPEAHHTVEEIWYFSRGRGEMWRKLGDQLDWVVY